MEPVFRPASPTRRRNKLSFTLINSGAAGLFDASEMGSAPKVPPSLRGVFHIERKLCASIATTQVVGIAKSGVCTTVHALNYQNGGISSGRFGCSETGSLVARRRRGFYARDSHGRFARVAGSKGVYRRKSSTGRKVAIAGATVAVAAGVAGGIYVAHEVGKSKGWEVGKAHGVYEASPLRVNGRFTKGTKRDVSKNPYTAGTHIRSSSRAARSYASKAVRNTSGRKVKR